MSRSSPTGPRDPHHGRQVLSGAGKEGRQRARQYRVLLLVFLGTILATTILHFSGSSSFEPYLGPSNPVATAAAVILLGAAALLALDARDGFRVQREAGRRKGLFFAAGLASLCAVLEPIFQTVLGRSDALPLAATVAVALHVFALNLLQLWVFKRFDSVSMLAFRLVFYACWHLLWDYARLQLLF